MANNKFWFSDGQTESTFVTFAPDGSFWVGDGGNQRNLHFDANRTYIDQIAFVAHSYSSVADSNNAQRVFSDFLEFSVNYGAPAGTGWTLVKNWGAGLPAGYFQTTRAGIQMATTLSNGHTYCKVWNNTTAKFQIAELVGNQLRVCNDLGTTLGNCTLTPEGDLIWFTANTASWCKQVLSGFDASNNPTWSAAAPLASAPSTAPDPAPRCCGSGAMQTPVTSTNVVISYDTSKTQSFHLGGVSVGGTAWKWRAMPAVTSNVPLDGLGSYDIGDGVNYGGNRAMTVGRHIIAGYNGEGWNQGQAAQYMHFWDNGLFVGQFGTPGSGQKVSPTGALAGFAGNGFSPSMVKNGNEIYMYTNDESAHGPQRWHLVGTNSLREFSGSGTLGGASVTVAPLAVTFPTGLASAPGSGIVRLTWNVVPGAVTYNVKYSTVNGGPYTAITGVTGANYTVTGLTNGTHYYFVVSGVNSASVESANSDQVMDTPFDTSAVVQTAGEQSTVQQIYNVNSTAPANGNASLTGLNPMFGNLSLYDIGSQGYAIFNYNTANNNLINVVAPFTVTKGTGWINDRRVTNTFTVDGVPESDSYAVFSNTVGTINISTTDTYFHYLTVFVPSQSADLRGYTLKLTPQGLTSPAASYVVPPNSAGISHTYQFRFKGNVTLTMDSTGGSDGIVKAIFLDNVAPHSLKAEYYNGQNFNTLVNTVLDPNVNFDWGTASPLAGVNADGFSTRWTGFVTAIEAGTYTFTTASDDGARLWVNNIQLVDKWVPQSTQYWSGTVTLTAGQRVPIKMEYFEQQGGAAARLYWTRPGQGMTIIPSSQFSAAP